MHPLAFFNRANVEYIDELYEKYQKDPMSVEEPWRSFFLGFDAAQRPETARPLRRKTAPTAATPAATDAKGGAAALVHGYRELGHWIADIDPLQVPRAPQPLLDLGEFGYRDVPTAQTVGNGGFLGRTDGTLGGLLEALRRTYSGTLAVEYMHIPDKAQRTWIQEQFERDGAQAPLGGDEARRTYKWLQAAEAFETFLHTRFLGQKRFSCEGGETLLPMLGAMVDRGGELETAEFVLGMAHRGRLNVLAHLLNKPYEAIFAEFLGAPMTELNESEGDVKYHLGYRNLHKTPSGAEVSVYLSPNPSHLELVDPVVEGIACAKQHQTGAGGERRIVPVLIHGEAAFTGQGIVFETLSLAQLDRYSTAGTIHVIVNNQVGFTATPAQTRAAAYPTEAAKLVHAPVLHVNGSDPEAAVRAARFAIEFRQKFGRDVFIDLWCHRKYGHNESDDPTFTQPLMYKRIEGLRPVAEIYRDRLAADGRLTERDLETVREERHGRLEESYAIAKRHAEASGKKMAARSERPARLKGPAKVKTSVSAAELERIARHVTQMPERFTVHPKLGRLMAQRLEMTEGKKPMDWGCAEMLALGSLLLEGVPVRLTGQDSERGTFSHRHAVLHDVETGATYAPLAHLDGGQPPFVVLNTMLSELAVLGFEYGYAVASPQTLVLWEAQFGDFVNGAQPILDQFLAAGEAKWQLPCGLTLLLPHGYEGQGPEHSSARLERFLQLCAEDNLQICQPTTPAQCFHLYRRQGKMETKKPLIVMTPKSLLRHPQAVSTPEDLTQGAFSPVLDEASGGPGVPKASAVRRVLLCSGKVYYALAAAREKAKADDVAILRLEQLYPFPLAGLKERLAQFPAMKELLWVQDEPRNMGAWTFVMSRASDFTGGLPLGYAGRAEAASPATGIHKHHDRQEAALVEAALGRKA